MNNRSKANPAEIGNKVSSNAAIALLENFFEQAILKERIQEDKIKMSLGRFNRNKPLNMIARKKRR